MPLFGYGIREILTATGWLSAGRRAPLSVQCAGAAQLSGRVAVCYPGQARVVISPFSTVARSRARWQVPTSVWG